MARILLNRITQHLLDNVVSESQCSFRNNRGTVDMIFAICQLREMCCEQKQNLYIIFVVLTKAFDAVIHDGLSAILAKLNCPLKFVRIIKSFHDGMMTHCGERLHVRPLPSF